jgi:hypothetical protein
MIATAKATSTSAVMASCRRRTKEAYLFICKRITFVKSQWLAVQLLRLAVWLVLLSAIFVPLERL